MRKPDRKTAAAAFLAALLCAPLAGVQAQTIYKYINANGVVEYSSTRPMDRTVISEIDAKGLSPEQSGVAEQLRSAEQARDAAANARIQNRLRQIDEASNNIALAQQRLREAEQALEAGREPLPGERTGTVSGRSRLNEAYGQRIAGLEQAVARARYELELAYRARNAL